MGASVQVIRGDGIATVGGGLQPVEEPAARQWTREEYHRAADVGIFRRDEKLELIDGEIISVSPVGSQHSITVYRISQCLTRLFGVDHYVTSQQPIILNDMSEPEPDVFIATGDWTLYVDHHPTAADLLLVVEVSDSSFNFDKTRKGKLYNTCGIPEYWIVDLALRRVEIFRITSADSQYQSWEAFEEDAKIYPLFMPDASISVTDLFPPKRP
jgi:Uma2 family endonuclease